MLLDANVKNYLAFQYTNLMTVAVLVFKCNMLHQGPFGGTFDCPTTIDVSMYNACNLTNNCGFHPVSFKRQVLCKARRANHDESF